MANFNYWYAIAFPNKNGITNEGDSWLLTVLYSLYRIEIYIDSYMSVKFLIVTLSEVFLQCRNDCFKAKSWAVGDNDGRRHHYGSKKLRSKVQTSATR